MIGIRRSPTKTRCGAQSSEFRQSTVLAGASTKPAELNFLGTVRGVRAKLFAPCGPPSGWREHRRESLSRFNKLALLPRVLVSRIEIVQSSLNGKASDCGISHQLALTQSPRN